MAKIVILEDEPILQQLMQEELEKRGHKVVAASDGQAGWALIQEQKPDLILLDLLMPLMSGYDVLAQRAKHADLAKVPCIVISNSGQADDLNRAYAFGATDVLIKADFDAAQLGAKIDAHLAKQ